MWGLCLFSFTTLLLAVQGVTFRHQSGAQEYGEVELLLQGYYSQCEVGEWSEWLACDCNTGLRNRTREVIIPPGLLSVDCKAHRLECDDNCRDECPGTCKLGEWSEWTSCDCVVGARKRVREVFVPPGVSPVNCHAHRVENKYDCDEQCRVDCEYEVSCGECSTSCGEGIKTCTGHILQKPKYGGKKCPFNHGKTWTEQCTKPPCKPEHCEEELRCGKCSADCGKGEKTCTAHIIKQPRHGGRKCRYTDGETLTKYCTDLPKCEPVDCIEKLVCGDCSATCGDAMKTCTVKIIQEPLHGGKKCRYTSGATLTKTCELDPCPKSCPEHLRSRDRKWRKKMDWDLDFIHNSCDNCKFTYNTDQLDSDNDGVGDRCDNCVSVANPDQTDSDHDGKGDECDDTFDYSPYQLAEQQEFDEAQSDLAAELIEKLLSMVNE